MARYSSERKAALLKKLLPPINMSVAELARQENISEVTLYNWRKHAKDGGSPVPGDNKLTDEWPAEAKFAVVLETAALSEIELSAYSHAWRSLNNIHADHSITSMPIAQ